MTETVLVPPPPPPQLSHFISRWGQIKSPRSHQSHANTNSSDSITGVDAWGRGVIVDLDG